MRFSQGLPLSPVQTVQHCCMQHHPTLLHATCCTVWTPCCTMLHDVARCCVKFDLVQTSNATSCNISIVLVVNEPCHNMLHPFERLCPTMLHSRMRTHYWIEWYPWRWGHVTRTEIQGGQVCLCLSRTVNFVDLTRDQCRKLPDFEQESSEVPVRFSDIRKRVSCSFRKCWLPK